MKTMHLISLHLIRMIIFILVMSRVTSHGQTVPELMYYKFDAPGNQQNFASAPVGSNPAILTGLTIGGYGQFSTALTGTGVANHYLNTGWPTALSSSGWTISMWLGNLPSNANIYYLWGDVTASNFRCILGGAAGAGRVLLRGGGLSDVQTMYIAPGCVLTFVYTGSWIKWYKDGIYIDKVSQPAVNITGTGPFLVGAYSTSIGLPSGGLMDEFRLYNRALSDSEISVIWNQQFPLASGPPVVTTDHATYITMTQATMNGTVNANNSTTLVTFEYGQDISYGSVMPGIPDSIFGTTVTPVHANLTGLIPNTVYHYRVKGVNLNGTAYGNDTTFLTPGLASVTTTVATTVTNVSASTGGNIGDVGIPSITERGVCWSTSENPTITGDHTSDGSGGGTFTSILTGLEPNTSYYYRAYATNSVGTAYGNELMFTTLAGWACGIAVAINHLAGTVAPVTKTVTYGTAVNIPGEPSKCWITSNLGAARQATAVNDNAEASAGWYWQFNLEQGYQHNGTTRIPNTTWINPVNEDLDWQSAQDPCALELGAAWRIPTMTEWENTDNTGGWTDWNGPWNSYLKMNAAGYLNYIDGTLNGRGSVGSYWSGSQFSSLLGWSIIFSAAGCNMDNSFNKSSGFTLRCLRDTATVPAYLTVSGTVTDTACYQATQIITVAGSGTSFTVANQGSAIMIAGQQIDYLPNTTVQAGGFMWGFIAPSGPFCQAYFMPSRALTEDESPFIPFHSFFTIYPNPTTGRFTLEMTGHTDKVMVDIYSTRGEKILNKVLYGDRMYEFSLEGRPAGVYIIRVITGDRTGMAKIIKH